MRRKRNKNRGHATLFDGVQFRSRLEARVAALFRILDWEYTYEPDLGLTYYIPDFFLSNQAEDVIVEVKPITRWNDKAVTEAQVKINESGYKGGVFLFGAAPRADSYGRTIFGLKTPFASDAGAEVMLPFHIKREEDFWTPCTCEEGCMEDTYQRTNQLWAKYSWHDAGNRVQWKKPRGMNT